MRFDDRLMTALGQGAETPAARQAVWRQLVDLLGHARFDDQALRQDALARLRTWRQDVPPASRQSAAAMLAGQSIPIDVVGFFAEDSTAVAAPLLATVELAGDQWTTLIPGLSPVARALLRHRRDLPAEARQLLDAYGPVDFVIPGPVSDPTAPEPSPHDGRATSPAPSGTNAETARDSFDFETDPDGVICWCDLDNRGGVIGLTIADPAAAGQHGVDGQTVGAFRHRATFKSGRLWIAQGAAAGAWALSGVPSFDPGTGRFLGYRGSARRPRAGERADQPHLLGLSLSGDSARQFAHEMRTPLNAIAGFAEMIQRQMLGPANTAYRDHAARIMAEAKRIGGVLDELEDAARLDAAGGAAAAQAVDCAQLLARTTSVLEPVGAEHGVLIALVIAPRCAPAYVNPATAERLVTRLLTTCLGVAAVGERLQVELMPGYGARPETVVAVSRPASLAALTETELYDACDIEGAPDEPALGLGFSLRFLRQAADACGGRFLVDGPSFRLVLPAVPASRTQAHDHADADWADWLRRQTATAACHRESGSAIAPDPVGPVAQW